MTAPRKGLVHQYTKRLTAFEHTPTSPHIPPQNTILFIGGLFDGLLTVPYTTTIALSLSPSWTLAEVHLSSSYTGFGTSSLTKDVAELAKCIAYFRSIKTGKIVLMGNSTGCQDIMHYLTSPGYSDRPRIDGGIIQGPVSDREAIKLEMDPKLYDSSCTKAKAMVAAGDCDEILPSKATNNFFPATISAKRWLSLASPDHDGEDDYFSEDLSDEQLMKSFGSLPNDATLCILHSGEDEYVAKGLDKMKLIGRWIGVVKRGEGRVDEVNSGVLVGVTHNLAGCSEDVVGGLVRQVLGFLEGLGAGSHSSL